MILYYFDPTVYSPQRIASLLRLKLREEPGPYAHFMRAGKPVGYVVRGGQVSQEGKKIQDGAVSLEESILIPPGVVLTPYKSPLAYY